jgi:aspartate oxidase
MKLEDPKSLVEATAKGKELAKRCMGIEPDETLAEVARLRSAVRTLREAIKGSRQKMATYVGIYRDDKELWRRLDEMDAAIASTSYLIPEDKPCL